MFASLALWINANAFPLLFTGLALHILCGIGIRRGMSAKALIVPSNLGQIIAVIAAVVPFFLPQGGDLFRGVLTFTLLWFLVKQNWSFYWYLKSHLEVTITSPMALQTMDMVNRLCSAGKLETLDSETTDEREQVLVKAVRQIFAKTSIFPKHCFWCLKNTVVSGHHVENLELCVASTTWRKKLGAGKPMFVWKYRLTLLYDTKGTVKALQAKAVEQTCGFLKEATGAEGKTYLVLRE